MRFLWAGGGDCEFEGIITSPAHFGIPVGVRRGLPWCAENEAYTRGFEPERFFSWLETMSPFRAKCLFVPVPDVVGNAISTLTQWRNWVVRFAGWPLAFVAQDGQEDLDFPDESMFSTLFIGGSTAWKTSMAAVECIRRAQVMGKHIHIGRVNWRTRYEMFALLKGSNEFTCDGTRARFDGGKRTARAWAGYQAQKPLFRL